MRALTHTHIGYTNMRNFMTRVVRKIQKSQQRRVDFWQLQNLSDKELRDIGITRNEIYYRVYKGS